MWQTILFKQILEKMEAWCGLLHNNLVTYIIIDREEEQGGRREDRRQHVLCIVQAKPVYGNVLFGFTCETLNKTHEKKLKRLHI